MIKKFVIVLLTIIIVLSNYYQSHAFENQQDDNLFVQGVYYSGNALGSNELITIDFNRTMIQLNDSIKNEVSINDVLFTPDINCKWAWINQKSLVCKIQNPNKLDRDAIYEIKISKSFTSFDGFALEQDYISSIKFRHIDALYANFENWKNQSFPLLKITLSEQLTKNEFEKVILNKIKFIETRSGNVFGVKQQKRDESEDGEKKSDFYIEPLVDLKENEEYALSFETYSSADDDKASSKNQYKELLKFKTFDQPRFVGIKCTNYKYESVEVDFENLKDIECGGGPMTFLFSSPIDPKMAMKFININPQLSDENKTNFFNSNNYYNAQNKLEAFRVTGGAPFGLTYFLDHKKTYRIEYKKEINGFFRKLLDILQFWRKSYISSSKFMDLFGRRVDEFKFEIKTSIKEPSLMHDSGAEYFFIGPKSLVIPDKVLMTEIKEFKLDYSLIYNNALKKNLQYVKVIDNETSSAQPVSLGVNDVLKNFQSAIIYGSINALPTDERYKNINNKFFAESTNFNITAKLGYNNMLFWVNDLNGNAVEGAQVSIKKFNLFDDSKSDLDEVFETGITDANGLLVIDKYSNTKFKDDSWKLSYRPYGEFYIVTVAKNEDIGWLMLSDYFKSGHNGFMDTYTTKYENITYSGYTGTGLYSAGEKVDYCVYVKDLSGDSEYKDFEYGAKVIMPDNSIAHTQTNISLSEFDSFNGSFVLPENIKTGEYKIFVYPMSQEACDLKKKSLYAVCLECTKGQKCEDFFSKESGHFFVSEFKKPTFEIESSISNDHIVMNESFELSNSIKKYTGEAAINKKLQINVLLTPSVFQPKFEFAQNFDFDNIDNMSTEPVKVYMLDAFTEENGKLKNKIQIHQNQIQHGNLDIETILLDDEGRGFSNIKNAEYFGLKNYIGIKNIDDLIFASNDEERQIQFLVVSHDGLPIHGTEVVCALERQVQEKWIRIDTVTNVSDVNGLNNCSLKFKEPGIYKIKAYSANDKISSTCVKKFIVFDNSNIGIDKSSISNAQAKILKISTEKDSYKIGDKANIIIEHNFSKGSRALVSIEKFGLIKQFVKILEHKLDSLEIDIDDNYAPGFYIDITVNDSISNLKIDELDENSILDSTKYELSKNARTQVNVIKDESHAHKLIELKTKRQEYRAKERIEIAISNLTISDITKSNMHTKQSRNKISDDDSVIINDNKNELSASQDLECNISIIDKALFDLLPNKNDYFNADHNFWSINRYNIQNFYLFGEHFSGMRPLGRMMTGMDLSTKANNQFKNIGTKYENTIFTKFGFVIAAGQSEVVQFNAPDNNARLMAICVCSNKNGYIFNKNIEFNVRKNIEIKNSLPSKLFIGEKLDAQFNIINNSKDAVEMTLDFNIKNTGLTKKLSVGDSPYKNRSFEKYNNGLHHDLVLSALEERVIEVPIDVRNLVFDNETNEGKILISLESKSGQFKDESKYEIIVNPAIIKKYILQEDIIKNNQDLIVPINLEKTINGGLSSLDVSISNTLLNNLENIFSTIKNYSYNIFIQKIVSMAAFANYKIINERNLLHDTKIFDNLEWTDGEKYLTEFNKIAEKFQNTNGSFSNIPRFDALYETNDIHLNTFALKTIARVEKFIDGSILDISAKNKLIKYVSEFLNSPNKNIEIEAFEALSQVKKIDNFDDYIEKYKNKWYEFKLEQKITLLLSLLSATSTENEKYYFNIAKNWFNDIYSYARKNDQFLSFEDKDSSNNTNVISCNCKMLKVMLNLKRYMPELVNEEMIFDLSHSVANSGHQINNASPAQIVECIDSITEYSMKYEKLGKINQKRFILSIDGQDELNEVIDVPNYIEINNLAKFIGKNVLIKIPKDDDKTGMTSALQNAYDDDDLDEDEEKENANLKKQKELESKKPYNIYSSLKFNLAVDLSQQTDELSKIEHSGLSVERDYYKQNETGEWVKIENISDLKFSDTIKVMINLKTNKNKNMIIVEEVLPHFAEYIDPSLNLVSMSLKNNPPHRSFFTNPEIDNGKIRFYSQNLHNGEFNLTYYFRIIRKGVFDILPIMIFEADNQTVYAANKLTKISVA